MITYILYVLFGSLLSGTLLCLEKRRKICWVQDWIYYVLVPILWPLIVPSLLVLGFYKLIDYILFNKKDKVDKILKRIFQYDNTCN